jgi:hypothetical protein
MPWLHAMEQLMRKTTLFALAIAAILAGAFGIWGASTPHIEASVAPTPSVDPMQMMSGARNLPTERVIDRSVVFE